MAKNDSKKGKKTAKSDNKSDWQKVKTDINLSEYVASLPNWKVITGVGTSKTPGDDHMYYGVEGNKKGTWAKHVHVNIGPTGDWIWRDVKSGEGGTIIDFISYDKYGSKNLGNSRDSLLTAMDYLHKGGFDEAAQERNNAIRRKAQTEAQNKSIKTFKIPEGRNLSYLESRGISNAILDDPRFKDRVASAKPLVFAEFTQFEEDIYFPFWGKDENGNTKVVSLERKNNFDTKKFKDLKKLIKERNLEKWDGIKPKYTKFFKDSSKDSLWIENLAGRKNITKAFIAEAVIDALSYAELKKDDKKFAEETLMIANGGMLTDGQVELLTSIFKRNGIKDISLSNDKDVSGRSYNLKYLGQSDLSENKDTMFDVSRFADQEGIEKMFSIKVHVKDIDQVDYFAKAFKMDLDLNGEVQVDRQSDFVLNKSDYKDIWSKTAALNVIVDYTEENYKKLEGFFKEVRFSEGNYKFHDVVPQHGKDWNDALNQYDRLPEENHQEYKERIKSDLKPSENIFSISPDLKLSADDLEIKYLNKTIGTIDNAGNISIREDKKIYKDILKTDLVRTKLFLRTFPNDSSLNILTGKGLSIEDKLSPSGKQKVLTYRSSTLNKVEVGTYDIDSKKFLINDEVFDLLPENHEAWEVIDDLEKRLANDIDINPFKINEHINVKEKITNNTDDGLFGDADITYNGKFVGQIEKDTFAIKMSKDIPFEGNALKVFEKDMSSLVDYLNKHDETRGDLIDSVRRTWYLNKSNVRYGKANIVGTWDKEGNLIRDEAGIEKLFGKGTIPISFDTKLSAIEARGKSAYYEERFFKQLRVSKDDKVFYANEHVGSYKSGEIVPNEYGANNPELLKGIEDYSILHDEEKFEKLNIKNLNLRDETVRLAPVIEVMSDVDHNNLQFKNAISINLAEIANEEEFKAVLEDHFVGLYGKDGEPRDLINYTVTRYESPAIKSFEEKAKGDWEFNIEEVLRSPETTYFMKYADASKVKFENSIKKDDVKLDGDDVYLDGILIGYFREDQKAFIDIKKNADLYDRDYLMSQVTDVLGAEKVYFAEPIEARNYIYNVQRGEDVNLKEAYLERPVIVENKEFIDNKVFEARKLEGNIGENESKPVIEKQATQEEVVLPSNESIEEGESIEDGNNNPFYEDQTTIPTNQAGDENILYNEVEFDPFDTEVVRNIKEEIGIIGNSSSLNEAVDTAGFLTRANMSVLISGENGSGKEHFAEIIHNLGTRKDAQFIKVNTAALDEETAISELFGHKKGSFTGAENDKKGYFEVAEGGTIFLDEIGETTPKFQQKLLRVLQDGTFTRLGEEGTVRKANVRIVAATNIDIPKAISVGKFREDLYHRIASGTIFVPPLRNRGNDVILLANHFLAKYGVDNVKELSKETQEIIKYLPFSGNVRELQNLIRKINVIEKDNVITPNMLVKHVAEKDYKYFPENVVKSLDKKEVLTPEQIEAAEGIQERIGIIGQSSVLRKTVLDAHKVSRHDINVLIRGENGTGKEHFSKVIHNFSDRSKKAIIDVDMGALSENLASSQLFGHKKGSFTGASDDKKGVFELANGGTVFLDEIGNLSLDNQAKLLRVLENGEVMPKGSTEVVKVDVRIVSATNENLEKAIDEGRFREDLYQRLNGYTVNVSPLRERGEDKTQLLSHFIEKEAEEQGLQKPTMTNEFLKLIESEDFKSGNIRQLQGVAKLAVAKYHGKEILVAGFKNEFERFRQIEEEKLKSTEKEPISEANDTKSTETDNEEVSEKEQEKGFATFNEQMREVLLASVQEYNGNNSPLMLERSYEGNNFFPKEELANLNIGRVFTDRFTADQNGFVYGPDDTNPIAMVDNYDRQVYVFEEVNQEPIRNGRTEVLARLLAEGFDFDLSSIESEEELLNLLRKSANHPYKSIAEKRYDVLVSDLIFDLQEPKNGVVFQINYEEEDIQKEEKVTIKIDDASSVRYRDVKNKLAKTIADKEGGFTEDYIDAKIQVIDGSIIDKRLNGKSGSAVNKYFDRQYDKNGTPTFLISNENYQAVQIERTEGTKALGYNPERLRISEVNNNEAKLLLDNNDKQGHNLTIGYLSNVGDKAYSSKLSYLGDVNESNSKQLLESTNKLLQENDLAVLESDKWVTKVPDEKINFQKAIESYVAGDKEYVDILKNASNDYDKAEYVGESISNKVEESIENLERNESNQKVEEGKDLEGYDPADTFSRDSAIEGDMIPLGTNKEGEAVYFSDLSEEEKEEYYEEKGEELEESVENTKEEGKEKEVDNSIDVKEKPYRLGNNPNTNKGITEEEEQTIEEPSKDLEGYDPADTFSRDSAIEGDMIPLGTNKEGEAVYFSDLSEEEQQDYYDEKELEREDIQKREEEKEKSVDNSIDIDDHSQEVLDRYYDLSIDNLDTEQYAEKMSGFEIEEDDNFITISTEEGENNLALYNKESNELILLSENDIDQFIVKERIEDVMGLEVSKVVLMPESSDKLDYLKEKSLYNNDATVKEDLGQILNSEKEIPLEPEKVAKPIKEEKQEEVEEKEIAEVEAKETVLESESKSEKSKEEVEEEEEEKERTNVLGADYNDYKKAFNKEEVKALNGDQEPVFYNDSEFGFIIQDRDEDGRSVDAILYDHSTGNILVNEDIPNISAIEDQVYKAIDEKALFIDDLQSVAVVPNRVIRFNSETKPEIYQEHYVEEFSMKIEADKDQKEEEVVANIEKENYELEEKAKGKDDDREILVLSDDFIPGTYVNKSDLLYDQKFSKSLDENPDSKQLEVVYTDGSKQSIQDLIEENVPEDKLWIAKDNKREINDLHIVSSPLEGIELYELQKNKWHFRDDLAIVSINSDDKVGEGNYKELEDLIVKQGAKDMTITSQVFKPQVIESLHGIVRDNDLPNISVVESKTATNKLLTLKNEKIGHKAINNLSNKFIAGTKFNKEVLTYSQFKNVLYDPYSDKMRFGVVGKGGGKGNVSLVPGGDAVEFNGNVTEGIIISNSPKQKDKLVIVQSPEEAISYHMISPKSNENTMYFSSTNGFNDKQIKLINQAVDGYKKHENKDVDIVIAIDKRKDALDKHFAFKFRIEKPHGENTFYDKYKAKLEHKDGFNNKIEKIEKENQDKLRKLNQSKASIETTRSRNVNYFEAPKKENKSQKKL